MKNFFELSPLDKIIVVALILLTFVGTGLKLVKVAGDEYLDFLRWEQHFQQERKVIVGARGTAAGAPVAVPSRSSGVQAIEGLPNCAGDVTLAGAP